MNFISGDECDYPNADEMRGLAKRAEERGVFIEAVQDGARVDHFAHDPTEGRLM
jgi:hypothetical protein